MASNIFDQVHYNGIMLSSKPLNNFCIQNDIHTSLDTPRLHITFPYFQNVAQVFQWSPSIKMELSFCVYLLWNFAHPYNIGCKSN